MTIPEAPIATAYAPPPAQPSKPSGFAIASLVVGIVAFLSGLAPVWGLLAGGAAVALGVVALMKKQHKALAITGAALGGLAFLASLGTTLAIAGIVVSSSPSTLQGPPIATESTSAAEAEGVSSASPSPTPAEEVIAEPATPAETVSQSNARRTAISYLEYSSFSRSGLIDQLIYEGFSTEDATYGVDVVGADWNAQAAATAASYLEYTSFSHSGLVDQLIYEGFTAEQAEYGVSTTGL